MKPDNIPDSGNLSDKTTVLSTISNFGYIAFVYHCPHNLLLFNRFNVSTRQRGLLTIFKFNPQYPHLCLCLQILSSIGNSVTRPNLPKYGSRIIRTELPTSKTPSELSSFPPLPCPPPLQNQPPLESRSPDAHPSPNLCCTVDRGLQTLPRFQECERLLRHRNTPEPLRNNECNTDLPRNPNRNSQFIAEKYPQIRVINTTSNDAPNPCCIAFRIASVVTSEPPAKMLS